MEKLVSIILPTYNGAHRIVRSIESVIEQSYAAWELLVIDDGSRDNTHEIIEAFKAKDSRIKYIRNEINSGIQKTLNRGLREAHGEYIARIDDDDRWIDGDKLKHQVVFLNAHADCVLVGTGSVVIDESGTELFRYLLPQSDREIRNRLLGKNCFVHSSVLFRKSAAIKAGGYGEAKDVRHLEDYDLWLKLGTFGTMANLPIYAIAFTQRNESLSSVNKLEIFRKIIPLIKKYKNSYPRYYWWLLKSVSRFSVYAMVCLLLPKLSFNKIKKFYKEN